MKNIGVAVTVAAALLGFASASQANSITDLQNQLDELKGRVQDLQSQKKSEPVQTSTPESGNYLKRVWDNTRLSGYGELEYIFKKDNGNGNGGNTLDPHRIVLNVTSQLADWIDFNSELEWEHGGSDGGADGGITVEQAYLNFKLNPALNVKAGVLLMPMGAINQNHEPTNFYSSSRPALDTLLIPSTWQEMGAGISGTLHKKVDYQLLAVTGLDGTGFSGAKGLRNGRQGFKKDSNRNFAVTGRLDIRPIENLTTSLSVYSGNSAPSGSPTAYTTIAAFDGRYRLGDFELAGEYVHVYQDRPEVLSDEIGRKMSGYWVEGAWHAYPAAWKKGKLAGADVVLFARYSELNTQAGGTVDSARTSGRFNRNYTTVGLSFMPVPAVAIKADYQFFGDHRGAGETAVDNDKFQVTVGFVF